MECGGELEQKEKDKGIGDKGIFHLAGVFLLIFYSSGLASPSLNLDSGSKAHTCFVLVQQPIVKYPVCYCCQLFYSACIGVHQPK